MHDHTLYSPEMMRRFLDDMDSPNVEAILDPVNLISAENYQDQDAVIARAFELYGDRISMVHIKDFRMEGGEPQFEHVGDGLFHYEPLLQWIKKEKPYITMLLENSNRSRYHSDIALSLIHICTISSPPEAESVRTRVTFCPATNGKFCCRRMDRIPEARRTVTVWKPSETQS